MALTAVKKVSLIMYYCDFNYCNFMLDGSSNSYQVPKFPDRFTDVDPKVLSVMQKSWSETPSERPTITEIKTGLAGFTKKL